MKLNIFIKSTEEMTSATPGECQFGELPPVITDDYRHVKSDDYIPVTNTGRRCDYFNCNRTDELVEIMNDVEEHPIVRHFAKEEYTRRLIRDYTPNIREGETAEAKMAKIIENAVNNSGFYQEKMADHFCQFAHRYLDQSLFEGFIRRYIIVHAWKWRNSNPGGIPMYYDDRNKYTCEACSKIVDALDWGYYLNDYSREMEKKMNR